MALRKANWIGTNKLVIYPGHANWTELFNFVDDPNETNNLAGTPGLSGLQSTMNSRLFQLLDDTGLMAHLSAKSRGGSNFVMTVRGGIGPNYQVEASTNLLTWQTNQQFQLENLETDITVTNSLSPAEFYRLEMESD